MFGHIKEKYFLSLDKAKKDLDNKINEAKKEPSTLSNVECQEEGLGDKNFKTIINNPESKKPLLVLKEVSYCYGIETNNESGHNYNIYCDSFLLTEIEVEE